MLSAVERPSKLNVETLREQGFYPGVREALKNVLGKRAQAPAGSTLVVELSSPQPQVFAVQIGEDGRGRSCAEVPADPTVRLSMDRETFIVLSGGRRRAEDVDVAVDGDQDLAGRVLAGMAVTP